METGSYGSTLKGRVALVTGAARGIGRAIAVELAHRGAPVAVNYMSNRADAETVAEEIAQTGRECLLVPGDVSSKEAARAVVEQVIDKFQRLDVLVNNAGITRDKSLRKMADDEWADVINVNLNGTYYCTSAALPVMIQQNFGRIINITSYTGQAGACGQANYAASKGGIAAFTRVLALEMAKYNITANAISPGYTCTEMMSGVPDEVLEAIKSRIPMGRLGKPEEIAKAAGFLAADAEYVTGQQLSVNGGFVMP